MDPFPTLLVPLITPLTDDTVSISEVRLARLIQWHVKEGAAGFVVASEAGEYGSLSLSERKQLLEWVVREAHGLPVYVNITANTTSSAVDLCQHASRHGARGAIISPPAHTPLLEAEVKAFLAAIRRHGNLAASFMDPYGVWSDLGDEASVPGGAVAKSLQAKELGEFAIYKTGHACEFWSIDGVCSPLGVFGAATAQEVLQHWPQIHAVAQGFFRIYGTARIGKATAIDANVDCGVPRGPIGSLDDNGRQLLLKILSAAS